MYDKFNNVTFNTSLKKTNDFSERKWVRKTEIRQERWHIRKAEKL